MRPDWLTPAAKLTCAHGSRERRWTSPAVFQATACHWLSPIMSPAALIPTARGGLMLVEGSREVRLIIPPAADQRNAPPWSAPTTRPASLIALACGEERSAPGNRPRSIIPVLLDQMIA